MSDDPTTLPPAVVAIIRAALAFLDADAAFGPEHERTARAKAQLQAAAQPFSGEDPLILTVIRGGQADEPEVGD